MQLPAREPKRERGFRFAVGIEDTFVPQVFPGHRALDEYELTQHYRFWSEDLALAADAGATAIRYGFPWYRLNPAPGRAIVRGVVADQRAVAAVSGGQASFVHVEATFRYVGETSVFADEVELLRARQFLVQDLLRGRSTTAAPWPPTCAATASATTTWPGRPPTRPFPTCSGPTTTRT